MGDIQHAMEPSHTSEAVGGSLSLDLCLVLSSYFLLALSNTVGCDRNRMPLLSEASNVVQNVFFLYDVTGFTQIGHSIPVATNFKHHQASLGREEPWQT